MYKRQALYGAVDLAVVGWFNNAETVAGVSVGTQVTQMLNSLISGLTLGGTILIAQYVGARRQEEMCIRDSSMIEHVVEREVHGASYSHKIAVANVIVNRVLDSRFPDNVADVLHAPGQFPVSIKNYYSPKWTPDDETINAVYALSLIHI